MILISSTSSTRTVHLGNVLRLFLFTPLCHCPTLHHRLLRSCRPCLLQHRQLHSARAVSASSNDDTGVFGTGKVYTKVCEPTRFAALGLNMTVFQYCNTSLSYADRVRDLIGWMTVEEKVGGLGDWTAGAPRIGLPAYKWWSEALHGLSTTGPTTKFDNLATPHLHSGTTAVYNATVFANVINSAASFNETLWKSIGQAVSTEARAMYNMGKGGMTYWSPNINVVRDPRWGRALETPGEDPYVVGRYAVNFVRGMQDIPGHETVAAGGNPNTRPIKTSACCKHYAAYDLDDWNNNTRFKFDARVKERDMVETFQRPFEMCVHDGDVCSVMCSYNRINGIPACADAHLLSQTIRGDWQLHGYIVSDCDAVRVMTDNATWLGYTAVEASVASLKAGLDLDCGESWIKDANGKPVMDFFTTYGMDAVNMGKMRESDIDKALTNQYMTLMRLGYFDDIAQYSSLSKKDIYSDEHRSLAVDEARQGMVLLKYENNLLPLDAKKVGRVTVHGPHIQAPEKVMDEDYTGPPCRYVTPRQGVSRSEPSCGPGTLVVKVANAIADVIFGEYNPGGRLPLTWFKNKTYKFYDGPEVLYPSGYGLSYTKFLYKMDTNSTAVTIPVASQHCKKLSYKSGVSALAYPAINVDGHTCTETISFNVSVINSGGKGSSQPVIEGVPATQQPAEVDDAPIKQVVAFQRVFVHARSTVNVSFTLNVCKAFSIVEKTAYTVVPSGVSTVLVENGDSSVSFPVKINLSV
ncbi:hypothetical protein ABZP36_008785 [Zizania latifolia]